MTFRELIDPYAGHDISLSLDSICKKPLPLNKVIEHLEVSGLSPDAVSAHTVMVCASVVLHRALESDDINPRDALVFAEEIYNGAMESHQIHPMGQLVTAEAAA